MHDENILAKLHEEKNKLSNSLSRRSKGKARQLSSEDDPTILTHYKYILPLVKDIHLLELNVKEKQRELEQLTQQKATEALAQSLLAESLDENDCVLKRWHNELQEQILLQEKWTDAPDKCSINNVAYNVHVDDSHLVERLAFTVLSGHVLIRVRIKAKMKCPSMHLIYRSSAKVGVTSDTFVPDLETIVTSALTKGKHVKNVISFLSNYMLKDVAPFVIVVPMKKSKKKKKT